MAGINTNRKREVGHVVVQDVEFADGTVQTTAATGGGGGIAQLTGDVTAGPGSGSLAATIAANAVTNAKLAQMADQTFKGNLSGGTANPSDLTLAQVKTALSISESAGLIFGSGIDGNATVTTNNLTASANGVNWITNGKLTRDVYFNNLTISGSGQIQTVGFRIHGIGTLDLSAASAGCLTVAGNPGSNAVSSSGALGGALPYSTAGSIGAPAFTLGGGTGGSGTTTTGGGAAGGGNSQQSIQNGGNVVSNAINSGDGQGSSGGSGTQISPAQATAYPVGMLTVAMVKVTQGGTTFSALNGGGSGAGGPAGGGNGTLAGGGGGGGGSGAGVMFVAFRTIATGSNTTAGLITIKGGDGGTGGTQTSNPVSGGVGGGQGGVGGGGGWLKLAYQTRTGSTVTNGIDHSGGTGGAGGAGKAAGGTGNGGGGGPSGGSGMVEIYNLGAGAYTAKFPVAGTTPGAAHVGSTGGGSTANTQRTDL